MRHLNMDRREGLREDMESTVKRFYAIEGETAMDLVIESQDKLSRRG
jgi:hypothetical protein